MFYVLLLGMDYSVVHVTINKSEILQLLGISVDSIYLFATNTICFVKLLGYILAGVVRNHHDMDFWRCDNTCTYQDSIAG